MGCSHLSNKWVCYRVYSNLWGVGRVKGGVAESLNAVEVTCSANADYGCVAKPAQLN